MMLIYPTPKETMYATRQLRYRLKLNDSVWRGLTYPLEGLLYYEVFRRRLAKK